jgi:5-methylcytosine-specific restriction endonuclease McrA
VPECLTCKQELAESEFRVRTDRNNWRVGSCKPCERATQLRNYYRAKERDPRRWRLAVIRNNRKVSEEWLLATLAGQENRCALTGRPIDIDTLEVDHVVARSKGGGDETANLRLVCREANMAKYDLSDAEFIALCLDVVRKSSAGQSLPRSSTSVEVTSDNAAQMDRIVLEPKT